MCKYSVTPHWSSEILWYITRTHQFLTASGNGKLLPTRGSRPKWKVLILGRGSKLLLLAVEVRGSHCNRPSHAMFSQAAAGAGLIQEAAAPRESMPP